MRNIISATVAILLVLAFMLPGMIVTPAAAIESTGTIIINKFTTPSSTTSFGFTDNITAPNSFSLAHGETITFLDVLPGTYVVTEDDPGPFYALTAMACLDPDGGSGSNLAARTVTIDLDPGETVECSFENESQTGTIIINKFTTPLSTTSFGFTDNITAPNSFSLAHGETITFLDVLPGTYVVTEDDPGPFYALTAMMCLDPDGGSGSNLAARTVTIDLDPRETVECSFENESQTGTIIINKFTTPSSTTSFGFTDNITAPNSFSLAHGETITFLDVLPGTYVVTEDDPGPFYALTAMMCLDPDGGSGSNLAARTVTIDLDPGETVECSFENELQTGTITAHKFNDRNGNGIQDAGEEDIDGWLMTLYAGFGCVGFEIASGITDGNGNVIFSNLQPGDYSVQELSLLGWQNTTPIHQDVTLPPGGSEIVSFGNQEAICVAVDVKPTSCPNPLNVKSKGVLPIAILGTADFDVTTIDPASIRLSLELSTDPGISPLRWSYEDVGTPYLADDGGCHTLGADGYIDLLLHFNTPSVVALDLSEQANRDVVVLQITGNLMEEFASRPIIGQDEIVVINK